MINSKKIAIILGAYNAEKYIAEQIDSIITQTYKCWDLYIRDDSSQDATLDIIRKYSQTYDNIHIIYDDFGNLGCNGNYFWILQNVEADYYMFCNADDYWTKDKIELSFLKMINLEKLHSNEIPIIVHTDLIIADHELNVIHKSLWKYNNLDPKDMYSYNRIGVCNTVAGATMFFNEKVKKITFPVSVHAPFFDHWMALKVLELKGVIVPIYQATVYYRQIGTNLAAVNLGNSNTFFYKFRNIKKVVNINLNEARMLKNIKWGGYLKYIYFKMQVFIELRFINKIT